MRVTEARELFRQLTAKYFAGATVTFSNQSRVAKPIKDASSTYPNDFTHFFIQFSAWQFLVTCVSIRSGEAAARRTRALRMAS